MFIECVKNNGTDYLRLVQGVRVTNKNGYRTSQKKLILSIGPLSRFDDGQPNYLERLKKSFKAGTPLIPALEPYCSAEKPEETYHIQIREGSPDCFGHPKLFSNILLERIPEENGDIKEKGLRKMGVCKEERKLPIVQMGLFMDDNGIPIAVETFPGNTLDHLTLRPALKRNIDGLDFSHFILIADRGNKT